MRKVLVSLLVVAMVLGLVGSVAAAFSDTATVPAAKYIDKATAFGWLKGYPDGSFKPAGNITRAEFAAVVVRALGLEAAASSTSGLATKFNDVKSTDWFAGYINVMTNKGIAKGYPDGSFKPNANVSNAEAVTMIVRALNREADAVGEWPVGHITVAAAQSIIGSGFVSNALASRADVSTYIAKAADVKFKELTTNGWVESATQSFLKSNNLEKITGNVINVDTGNKTVTVDVDGTSNTYTLKDGAIIAGGLGLIDIKGYGVDLFKDKDTGKAVFIEQSTTTTVKKGDVRAVGADYFYLYDDTTKYQFTTKVSGGATVLDGTIVRNLVTAMQGNQATMIFDPDNAACDLAVDDTVTFFIGNNGYVNYVTSRGYKYARTIVSDLYTAGTPYSLTVRRISSGAFTTNTFNLATDAKVEMNGAEAKFTDIKKGDVVSVAIDPNNTSIATIVNGTNKVVTGKVTARRIAESEDATRRYVSVDGVEYRLESTAEVKDSDTYTNSGTGAGGFFDKIKVGQTVSLYLSQRSRVRVIEFVSGIADMGRVKRFITATTGSYNSWVLDMKGTETTYEVAKDSTGTSKHDALKAQAGSPLGPVGTGDYVALTFDADGRIDAVEKLVNITAGTTVPLGNVYSGDKIVTINGIAYLVTNDTLLYVNDAPGSLSSVAKDQRAAVAFNTGTEIKLKALVVDTFAKMDTNAIVANTSNVYGYDKAAEFSATVEVYSDAAMTTLIANGTADKADATGGLPASSGYAGGFKLPYHAGEAPAAGATIYVKVTDRFGNTTSAPITVK